MTSTNPGDFSNLSMTDYEKEMLSDAYGAITKCKLWDYMKTYSPKANEDFRISEPSHEILRINKGLNYDYHNGLSYDYTMRVMEFIAKNGWDNYVNSRKDST